MPRTLSAALVFGAKISNGKGHIVGEIEDLLVDLESGHVIYAIVSFVNDMGVEGNYFPIPIKAIKESNDNKTVELAFSKEKLRNAPSFKKKNWPKEYDEYFIHTVYKHYGYEPSY